LFYNLVFCPAHSLPLSVSLSFASFFFTDPATPAIYTLSLHDALPIYRQREVGDLARTDRQPVVGGGTGVGVHGLGHVQPVHDTLDRKSTRLNSSHSQISYAVFCLKKKKKNKTSLKLKSNSR